MSKAAQLLPDGYLVQIQFCLISKPMYFLPYQHLQHIAKNTSAEKYSLSKGLSGHMNLENTE